MCLAFNYLKSKTMLFFHLYIYFAGLEGDKGAAGDAGEKGD